MERELFIRDADPEDAKKLVEIYSYYVLNTAVSFEYEDKRKISIYGVLIKRQDRRLCVCGTI